MLFVRGTQQLFGDRPCVPGNPCPHLRGIPFLPPLLGLFVVLLAQLLYLSFPLFTLLVEHFTHTAYGFLLFKRHPVGIRFLLPHLIGDHAVNDVVGDLLHRCVTIPGKRILINRVHAVQHIRDPIELVGLGIHVTGEIALAEHLRHLRIDRIYRYAVCLVQLHCAHVLFAELVVVIHLSVEKDLLPLQIILDFQQLRAVLCQLRRVVHDFFSHALCVRHQVGHAYVLLHHSLAQRLHVGLNVRVLYVAVIPPDGIQPQPLHVPQHYGRLLADTHFALQVLHSLFQCAVAAGQYCALPLQIAHLLLNVRCASQLITEPDQLRHMGRCPVFKVRIYVVDDLATVRSLRIFRAGHGVPVCVVQIQYDLTTIFADEVRQCIKLCLCGHDRQIDAAAFRADADIALAHKLHHSAAIIFAAVVKPQRIANITVVYSAVAAGAAIMPAGKVQLCAVRGDVPGLVPPVRFTEKLFCGLYMVFFLRLRVRFQ